MNNKLLLDYVRVRREAKKYTSELISGNKSNSKFNITVPIYHCLLRIFN